MIGPDGKPLDQNALLVRGRRGLRPQDIKRIEQRSRRPGEGGGDEPAPTSGGGGGSFLAEITAVAGDQRYADIRTPDGTVMAGCPNASGFRLTVGDLVGASLALDGTAPLVVGVHVQASGYQSPVYTAPPITNDFPLSSADAGTAPLFQMHYPNEPNGVPHYNGALEVDDFGAAGLGAGVLLSPAQNSPSIGFYRMQDAVGGYLPDAPGQVNDVATSAGLVWARAVGPGQAIYSYDGTNGWVAQWTGRGSGAFGYDPNNNPATVATEWDPNVGANFLQLLTLTGTGLVASRLAAIDNNAFYVGFSTIEYGWYWASLYDNNIGGLPPVFGQIGGGHYTDVNYHTHAAAAVAITPEGVIAAFHSDSVNVIDETRARYTASWRNPAWSFAVAPTSAVYVAERGQFWVGAVLNGPSISAEYPEGSLVPVVIATDLQSSQIIWAIDPTDPTLPMQGQAADSRFFSVWQLRRKGHRITATVGHRYQLQFDL